MTECFVSRRFSKKNELSSHFLRYEMVVCHLLVWWNIWVTSLNYRVPYNKVLLKSLAFRFPINIKNGRQVEQKNKEELEWWLSKEQKNDVPDIVWEVTLKMKRILRGGYLTEVINESTQISLRMKIGKQQNIKTHQVS